MTVVVAARTGDRIVMAADAQCLTNWQSYENEEPKVWTTENGWILGGSGCVRLHQVMRHHVYLPSYAEDGSEWEQFLVRKAIPKMRDGLDGHGIVTTKDGVDSIGGCTLVAYGTRLAVIYDNYAVAIDQTGRTAIGGGRTEAVGFLGGDGPWTEEQVIEAVRRARHVNASVGGPVTVVDTIERTPRLVDP